MKKKKKNYLKNIKLGYGIDIDTETHTISRKDFAYDYQFGKGLKYNPLNNKVYLNLANYNALNGLTFNENSELCYSAKNMVTGWVDFNSGHSAVNPQIYPEPPSGSYKTSVTGRVEGSAELPTNQIIYVSAATLSETAHNVFHDINGSSVSSYKILNSSAGYSYIMTAQSANGSSTSSDIFDPNDTTKFVKTDKDITGGKNFITDQVNMVPDNVMFIW